MSAAEVIDVAEVTDAPESPISTALDVRESESLASYLPVPAEWQQILQQAAILAASDLVPSSYRNKPQNVVLATLMGRRHGWDASMSMNSYHVIEGTPSLKPELHLALIREAGHSVRGETTPTEAVITGKRADNGDTMTTRFTLDDAVQADLCVIKDGRAYARSTKGKKLSWELYTEDMLWARCLSKLARRLFSDVELGAGYVPEELMGPGAWVSQDGEPLDQTGIGAPEWVTSIQSKNTRHEPEMMDDAVATALTARAQALPQDAKADLKAQMFERDIRGSFFSQTAAKVRILEPMIAAFEKRAAGGEWGEWQPLTPPVGVTEGGEVAPTEPVTEPVDVPDQPAPAGPTAKDVDDTWDAAKLATLELTELVKVDPGLIIDALMEWGEEIPEPPTPVALVAAFDAAATKGF